MSPGYLNLPVESIRTGDEFLTRLGEPREAIHDARIYLASELVTVEAKGFPFDAEFITGSTTLVRRRRPGTEGSGAAR